MKLQYVHICLSVTLLPDRQKQLSEKLASSNNRPPRESRETLEQRMAKAKEQRNKINEEKQDRLRLQRTKVY